MRANGSRRGADTAVTVPMIASLPMYDGPGRRAANDDLWAALSGRLRAHGIDAPLALTRSGDPATDWAHPGLLLSQTCGLPYRHHLHERLHLVAAPALWVPDRDMPGYPASDAGRPTRLPAGQYYSVVVARAEDPPRPFEAFDGARLAYNDPLSQSGWGLMHALAKARGIRFGAGTCTGAHRRSALAVVQRKADIAAIDVATWFALTREAGGITDHLRIVDRTALSPALPYVTAYANLVPVLFDALKSVLGYGYAHKDDLPALQDQLDIAPEGVVPADRAAYMAIRLPPSPPGAPDPQAVA